VAAVAAQAVVRPAAVAGADGDSLRIGEVNDSSRVTILGARGADGLRVGSDVGNGLWGGTQAAGQFGVLGQAGTSTGYGVGGANGPTGTEGYLGHPSLGVFGRTESGGTFGGLAGSSAVSGGAPLDTAHYGLLVAGRVAFYDRTGLLTIAAGKSSVSASVRALGPTGAWTATTVVLATLQTNRAGVYIQAAVANPRTGKITIYLNKKVTAATKVAYFLLDLEPVMVWPS